MDTFNAFRNAFLENFVAEAGLVPSKKGVAKQAIIKQHQNAVTKTDTKKLSVIRGMARLSSQSRNHPSI